MKALVSTINHLLYVDLTSKAIKVVESHRPRYYGISWWGNSDYPVLSHSGIAGEDMKTFAEFVHSEQGYLSFGEKQSSTFLSCPHQILCAPNGWIIAANTGRNRVTVIDPVTEFYKELRVNDINWDRMGDVKLIGEHFNSVFIRNERLYVLAHGFDRQSYVLEYAFPACELISRHDIPSFSGLHNLWIDDRGRMVSCHSKAGELIDIKTGVTVWKGAGSYVRGLAVTTDSIIVGDSEQSGPQSGTISQCGLWLVDRKTMKTQDYLPLGMFGGCREVRILDVADEAHHGKRFNNLAWLENLPSSKADNVNAGLFMQRRREKLSGAVHS